MSTTPNTTPAPKPDPLKKIIALTLLFVVIYSSIYVIRKFPAKESEFVDSVAAEIQQEMEDNQIVLSSKGGRRTVAEFKDPIILTHGKETKLIVYTATLSEEISISSEGLGGWSWTSAYQDIEYEGQAQYTVDLSQLSEEDFIINYEMKSLTVKIPYAVLSPINIPADKIRVHDIKRGWAAVKDIKMSTEENNQLTIEVGEKMKAKLIDENIIALANDAAKTVVADLFTAVVQSVDPEYTVVIVQ